MSLLTLAVFVAALGAGLNAGLFFIFSATIMTALGRLPPPNGIAAMQAINAVILNPVFFTVFFGTAALSLALVAAAVFAWGGSAAPWMLAGSLAFLVGVIAVTMVCNVPMNEQLARVAPASAEGARLWADYLSRWTAWNHLRSLASLVSLAAFIRALM